MFLSRLEGMLGYVPGINRSTPVAKRRRFRHFTVQEGDASSDFFATSNYSVDANEQARRKEVSQLFARMRNELLEIAIEFADGGSEIDTKPNANVRHGLFIEMLVASEFVLEELDHEIDAICLEGTEAEKEGAKNLEPLCLQAAALARLRARIIELQHELDTMLQISRAPFSRCSLATSLNFDPLTQGAEGRGQFVALFLGSVQDAIASLSHFATDAIAQRDFETAAQLALCNLQLDTFLSEARCLLARASEVVDDTVDQILT